MTQLFTIGHSNHGIDTFLALLHQHGVRAIADVRSHPHSRYLPHFSYKPLQQALQDAGLQYIFLGKELGARPQDPTCYVEGKAVYENIAATEAFRHGLQQVMAEAEQQPIALMCAEQDPLTCHRALLVCRHLRSYPLSIQHILKDGSLESHIRLEARLLKQHHLVPEESKTPGQLSLFGDPSPPPLPREELLEMAYQLQGDRLAYIEPHAASEHPDHA